MSHKNVFNHQSLDVYRIGLEFLTWCHLQTPHPSLKNQLIRASESIVLNIAEGAGQLTPAMKKKHYRIAFASAAESHAALDLMALHRFNIKEGEALVYRIGLMLRKLIR